MWGVTRRIFAGIGSRETPTPILEQMTLIGKGMAERGWILRSGGAVGADSAFEKGCDLANGHKEIFLPFPRYNNHPSSLYNIPPLAFDLIDATWKSSASRSEYVRAMFARNCQQILGSNLDDYSELVVCWTPSGKIVGGTGKAIQIALNHKIPVVNLYNTIDTESFFDII
jgi:hypothetical protein